jgi:proline-specific peptidase
MVTTRELDLDLPGRGRVHAWVTGAEDAPGAPLLVVHGGPAGGSGYLRTLDRLAEAAPGRRVVHWDQSGCGRSGPPGDPAGWTAAGYAAELGAVRDALGLDRVHLYGQSWGGMVVLEHLAGAPGGVLSAVLDDTAASTAEIVAGLARLRAALPPEVRAALDEGDRTGERESTPYVTAMFAFYQRHVCRLADWPPELLAMGESMMDNPVYETMWGPSELVPDGTLLGWDRRADLPGIRVPALVTVGRYGEITPDCAETIARGLPDARLVVFEESAHLPHLEEPTRWFPEVARFLAEHDAEAGA